MATAQERQAAARARTKARLDKADRMEGTLERIIELAKDKTGPVAVEVCRLAREALA